MAGFQQAHDRFNADSQNRDFPEVMFVPLFEALNWTGALEERIRRETQHTDTVLMGLRFVRDRVVHQWAEAVHGSSIPNPAATVV